MISALPCLLFFLSACHLQDSGGVDDSTVLPSKLAQTCVTPVPILTKTGWPSGFVTCADGSVDRVAVVPVAISDYPEPYNACVSEHEPECTHDSDCTARAYGHCIGLHSMVYYCSCDYLCSTDEDCGGGACVPAELQSKGRMSRPQCGTAQCSTGADCPSGECGLAHESVLACRTPADQCRHDAHCRTAESYVCLPQADGAWECVYRFEGDPSR
jgi:hypothetical protein